MSSDSFPRHVAIIMDGNGRWAKKRGLPRIFGHREGAAAVRRIVTHAAKIGVKYLSIFAFSAENWLRPKEEVGFLMKLFDEYIASEEETILKNNIRFVLSGRLSRLPEKTLKAAERLCRISSGADGMTLNLLISYGAKDEITDAVRLLCEKTEKGEKKAADINEKDIKNTLYNPDIPDVDLLIRTSGEHRISNFMLWQIAYAELYFTDVLWPDFSEKDFDEAISDFSGRVRRFGMTDEQLGR